MKKRLIAVLPVLVVLLGLGLALYPTLAHSYNMIYASHAIDAYESAMEEMTPADYERFFLAARAYNGALRQLDAPLTDYEQIKGYDEALSVAGSNLMGYINIDKIHVYLPIYHGTSSAVLSEGVGHMQGTSLPVGGMDTHAILSAHRGLPQARLFTDLDQLEVGDTFTLTILNETLTYMVDSIVTADPYETNLLLVRPGEDGVTLLTCTPYGVNTHRLLVHGHRIENIAEARALHLTSDGYQVEPLLCSVFFVIPIALLLFMLAGWIDRLIRRY